MSNRISSTLGTTPGEHKDVVWVPEPDHSLYDPAMAKVVAWCERQGLDASMIPHPAGLVICLDSPDGGLVAYVTEYAEKPAQRPVRRVEVDSVPPAGGIVPEWAAYLLREAAV